jgi:hypothetical protein
LLYLRSRGVYEARTVGEPELSASLRLYFSMCENLNEHMRLIWRLVPSKQYFCYYSFAGSSLVSQGRGSGLRTLAIGGVSQGSGST